MRALPCTRHRHAVMSLVLDAKIVTVPNGEHWQWRRDVNDLFTLDGTITTDSLTPAESRALGQLVAAKLIRISTAAPRTGRSKGVRRVFATDDGRDWWTKGYRARRGCTNGNQRGNSADRRRRRQWLLDIYGDGTTAPCWLAVPGICAGPVTAETISVERVQPGHAGGTYRRDNIRPACAPCQSHQGGAIIAAKKLIDVAACSA
jgi:hypothetical protein